MIRIIQRVNQMNKHYSYPSIPQFRTLLADLTHAVRYIGNNPETGKAMYNENIALPMVELNGTVKLHGANCSVVLTRDGKIYPQSKESLLDETVNCNGFYQFFEARETTFKKMLEGYLRGVKESVEAVVVYGEWCGPGIQKKVGISNIDSPIFVIFDVRYIDETYEKGNTGFIDYSQDIENFLLPSARIYPIQHFMQYKTSLDIMNPEMIQQQLIDLTTEVEAQCPVAKYFGVDGRGEGIVWTIPYNNRKYRMKVKGQKHSSTKVKVLANPDVEKIESLNNFLKYAFTENRLEQGISVLKQKGAEIVEENIQEYVRWVFADVIKEESDTMEKNGISSKDIAKKGNYLIRQYYMSKLNG